MEFTSITYYNSIVATISLLIAGGLAVIRIREYWRDNKGISVSHFWTGNPDISDYIYLTNLSATPILVDHWQLEWHERRILRKNKITPIQIFDDEDLHLTLKPRERKAIEFKDQYQFNWFPKNRPKAILLIRLYIAGRKRNTILRVFPN